MAALTQSVNFWPSAGCAVLGFLCFRPFFVYFAPQKGACPLFILFSTFDSYRACPLFYVPFFIVGVFGACPFYSIEHINIYYKRRLVFKSRGAYRLFLSLNIYYYE